MNYIKNVTATLLLFICCSSLLLAEYNVDLESSIVSSQCIGMYTITIAGDAGPFSYALYDPSGNVMVEASMLDPDIYHRKCSAEWVF